MKTTTLKTSIVAMLLVLLGLHGFAQLVVTPSTTPACHGNDGSLTFTVTGGSGTAYYYLQSVYPPYTQLYSSSPSFTGLAAGPYSLYVQQGADSLVTQVTIPSTVVATSTVTNATCPLSNGSIVTHVSGGTAPYTYTWNNGATTANITNIAGGNGYWATVADAGGCTAFISDTVYATSSLTTTIAISGPVCNPVLTASSSGGTGAVSYAWSTGAHTASINNLPNSDYYSVYATDANGCTATYTTYVSVTPLIVDSFNIVALNPTCIGNNGSLTLNMSNGTAPYTYAWSNGATGSTITALTAGTYYVTVTDAGGCTGTNSFYLYNTPGVYAYISNVSNPTCGSSDGSLSVYAYEANGTSGTYTYLWSNGATTAAISGLAIGTYTVTIVDQNTCSATVNFTLQAVGNFTVSVTTTYTTCDSMAANGTATAVATGGGTPPYTYNWTISSRWGTWRTSNDSATIVGLAAGDGVTATATDANGCISAWSYGDTATIIADPACFDHITGNVFIDANGNCTFDNGEAGISSGYVVANSNQGRTYLANPDANGNYDIEVLPGSYSVALQLFNNSVCGNISQCNTSYTTTFTTIGVTNSGFNFGVSNDANYDLGVHMGYQGSAPGQTRQYWVYYYNWGVAQVPSAVLTFTHDASITLASTTPPYTSYNAASHTITWDVTNIPPMQWINNPVVMYFNIPSNLPLGTLLTAQSTISPIAQDCDPSDNTQFLSDLVSASHDPNEKEVSPAGNLSAADTLLTYTIRFQNTGNAPATKVIITDTLSSNVDPASVIPGAASSAYTYKILGTNILTFTFDPIYLTDSLTNADSSKGFVMYTVKTKRNIAIGDVVNNTAYIYFDANPAIVTNTTSNERSNFATGITTVKGGKLAVQVLPNPANDKARIDFEGATGNIQLKITDALGKLISTNIVGADYFVFETQRLAAGIYFYSAQDASGNRASGKISVVH